MRTVPIWAAAVALLVAGCGSAASSNGKTSVVAAFYPLAYAAEQIGSSRVDVTNLTPPGAEPHDVELTPQEVGRIQTADVVLYLSHDFQPAVEQAVDGAKGTRVDALEGIGLRRGVGDEAGKTDPHVWLDPVLYARVVKKIGAALGRPQRAAALAKRVLAIDRVYRSGLADCKRKDCGASTSRPSSSSVSSRRAWPRPWRATPAPRRRCSTRSRASPRPSSPRASPTSRSCGRTCGNFGPRSDAASSRAGRRRLRLPARASGPAAGRPPGRGG